MLARWLRAFAIVAVALTVVCAALVSVSEGALSAAEVQTEPANDFGAEVSTLDTVIDSDSGNERRLVERRSDQRVDAVVIALWAIAGTMTVLLTFYLWHTSPRRRARLTSEAIHETRTMTVETETSDTASDSGSDASTDESSAALGETDIPESGIQKFGIKEDDKGDLV